MQSVVTQIIISDIKEYSVNWNSLVVFPVQLGWEAEAPISNLQTYGPVQLDPARVHLAKPLALGGRV